MDRKKRRPLMDLIIMKYISENIKPLALIAICGCVGYFLGSPMTGMVVGITIVASVTLLL